MYLDKILQKLARKTGLAHLKFSAEGVISRPISLPLVELRGYDREVLSSLTINRLLTLRTFDKNDMRFVA